MLAFAKYPIEILVKRSSTCGFIRYELALARSDTDTLARLDTVSALQPEFPYDMIDNTRGFVYGTVDDLVDHR